MMAKKRTLTDTATDPLAKMAKQIKGTEQRPTEGEDLKHLNTRIPVDLIVDIKVHCAKNNLKIQDFVTQALKDKLKARK